MIRKLDSKTADFNATLDALLAFESETDEGIERTVAEVLANVKKQGDAAVLEYTSRFDRLDAASMSALELPKAELKAAFDGLPEAQRKALEAAAERVTIYHERQKAESWEYTEANGTKLGQKVTPLDRVGLYVPGGKAAYPSSVLMNALPAKVAGVGELIMVVPTPGGERTSWCLPRLTSSALIACSPSVARRLWPHWPTAPKPFRRSTRSSVPGNAYVASAKRRVFGTVGIDMVAGPSEVLVIADASANPDWVAMDLFAQAEHDELAQSILLCPDAAFIEKVAASIEKLLPTMPRKDVIFRLDHRPRRPDPDQGFGRSLRDRQQDRAGTPGAVGRRCTRAGAQDSPCRRHLHWQVHLGIAGRLLRRPQPRAANLAQRPLLQPAGCL